MRLTKSHFIPALVTLALITASCGTSTPYDDDYYASTICVDPTSNIRVPDSYCPIGDAPINSRFTWGYSPYRYDAPFVDVVYVGYPVPSSYSRTRPANIRTTHLDRGRFAENPQLKPGDALYRPSSRTAPLSTIQRGGLGVPSSRSATRASDSVSNAQTPSSGTAPATRSPNASTANTAPTKAQIPPPPPSRPYAPPKSTPKKSGK